MDNKDLKSIRPYDRRDQSKKKEVAEMFDRISPSYDFLNHFLSFGIDRLWRKKVIGKLKRHNPSMILDVATGTGDLAIDMAKQVDSVIIKGIDIAQKMLDIGKRKLKKANISNVELLYGDSEYIAFDNETFDVTTAAFGVRNFENPLKGLREMHRVLKKGGHIYILEFSTPRRKLFGTVYQFYFKYVLPTIGRLFSKDKRAYTYLQESVTAFPAYEDFTKMLKVAGFKECTFEPLTFGICCIYLGKK